MATSTLESPAMATVVTAPGQPVDVVAFEDVSLAFDDHVVLDRVSFRLGRGGMIICLGASGAGKSTILRLLLGLLRPDSGRIFINGERVDTMSEHDLMGVRADIGMVFQEGALFDSLTVRENTGYRLFEETKQPLADVDRRVATVLAFVGLSEFADRMPAELSGGQRRRVGIARAMAASPRLILYDEPTTGLDPITALAIDAQIVKLRDLEGVTSVIVTHQLRDAFYIATHMARPGADGAPAFVPVAGAAEGKTRFVMLKDGHAIFDGTATALRASSDPYLRAFLS